MGNSFLVRMIGFHIILLLALPPTLLPTAALAHGAERGLVMLLPTKYYALGAMIAVALSFIILTSSKISAALEKSVQSHIVICHLPSHKPALFSLISLIVLFTGIYIGYNASRDPLSNLLPLSIWTGWWVGFSLFQVVVGNLWPLLNPWSGLLRLLSTITAKRIGEAPLAPLPRSIGYLPAIILFFAFAWFELVSLAPEDPRGLANAVALYWLINFVALVLFGEEEWFKRGEPFSIYFRLIGSFSPFARQDDSSNPQLTIQVPGASLYRAEPMPFSGICLILLILGSASFDGFSETFTWMGFWGINPLEYAGRSSTQVLNSFGLIITALVLGLAYFAALSLGWMLAHQGSFAHFAGRIIYSIVPISIGFHAAHYLTMMLINSQYLLKALSDPFSKRSDIFGTAHLHVSGSFVQNIDSVWIIWTIQVAIITLGHMAGIILAHMIAMDWFKSHKKAARSQVALAALMVFYTVFGLWLLSTPTVG